MTTVMVTVAFMTMLSSGLGAPAGSSVAQQEPAPAAQAGSPSDAAAIGRRVKEGQTVRIIDDQGREWQGRIEALAPDDLVLNTELQQRRQIPYTAIVRIDRPPDTLGNGALIGFLSGAALGLFAVVADETDDCNPGAFLDCGDPTTAAYLVVPGLLGATGAGIGVAIDALVRRDATLYRRGAPRVMLAPSVGGGARAVRLSVRW
jgi:hypothetical protein